eukprot:3522127-Pleurochrysis_carterae.AAC.1
MYAARVARAQRARRATRGARARVCAAPPRGCPWHGRPARACVFTRPFRGAYRAHVRDPLSSPPRVAGRFSRRSCRPPLAPKRGWLRPARAEGF